MLDSILHGITVGLLFGVLTFSELTNRKLLKLNKIQSDRISKLEALSYIHVPYTEDHQNERPSSIH